MSSSVEASTQTDVVKHPVSTSTDTQTYKTPRPRSVQATTLTKPPTRTYEKELEARIASIAETKTRHKEVIAQLGKLQE
mgnify:FL=1